VSVIATAGALPGRALLVLLAIRHRIDISGKPQVSLPAAVMRDFGLDRFAKSRALAGLERAGLIRVKRAQGRAVQVSLSQKRTKMESGDGSLS
jgi:DNA-binding MarR family transcriptional regulator